MTEEIIDKECPECKKKNLQSFLKLYQINLYEAIYMCPIKICLYPKGYKIIYVKRDIMQNDTNILTENNENNEGKNYKINTEPLEQNKTNSENCLDEISKTINEITFNNTNNDPISEVIKETQTENCINKSNGKIKVLSNESVSFPISNINNIIKNCDSTNHITVQVDKEISKRDSISLAENKKWNLNLNVKTHNKESNDLKKEFSKTSEVLEFKSDYINNTEFQDFEHVQNDVLDNSINNISITVDKNDFDAEINEINSIKTSFNDFIPSVNNKCEKQIKLIDKQEYKSLKDSRVPIKITYPKLNKNHNVTKYNPTNCNMEKLTENDKITPQALKTMNKLVNIDKKVKICFIDTSDNLHKFKMKNKKCNRLKLTPEQLSSSISAALAATKETNIQSSSRNKTTFNFKQNLFMKTNEEKVSKTRTSKFEGFNFEPEPKNIMKKQSKESNIKSDLNSLPTIDFSENIDNDFNDIESMLDQNSVENVNESTNTLDIDENILNDVLEEVNTEKSKNTNFEVEDVDDWLKSLIS